MHTIRLVLGASLTAVGLMLVACAGDDSPSPTPVASNPTPRSVPTEAPTNTPGPAVGTPAPAEPAIKREAGWGDVLGPVLVYERGTNPPSIVAYDLGNRRPIWSAHRHQEGAFDEAALVANGVVLATRAAVYLQDFKGEPLEKLFDFEPEWQAIETVAVAPDGVTVAFSIAQEPQPFGTPTPHGQVFRRYGRILFYDLNARREIREVVGTPEHSLAAGTIAWRSDALGVNLGSFTHSESPGQRSAVFLDGSLVTYDVHDWAYLAPNGKRMVHGISSQCMFIGGPDIYVRDLDTGRDIVAIHNDQRMFTGMDWSPDGDEFLFQSRLARQGDACEVLAEPTHLILNASTGLVSPAPDLEALYRRWYGDALVWVDCQGRFEPLAGGHIGWPIAYCSESLSPAEGRLRYQDLEVDSASFFRLHGITP